jgi:hypothetical protein
MSKSPDRFQMRLSDQDYLECGPRYRKPIDNTMCFGLAHKTTGGYVGVLMDDEDVSEFVRFLEGDALSFHMQCSQTYMQAASGPYGLAVKVAWNSGRSRTAVLDGAQVAELLQFMREALAGKWVGWLDPADVPPTFHGHVYVDGELLQPCRLCMIKGMRTDAEGLPS